jgi:hypothetical protein
MNTPQLACENSENCGKIGRSRRFEYVDGEETRQEKRDRIEHQTDDEFVDVELDAQKGGNCRPERAPGHRGDQRQRHMEECRKRREPADQTGKKGADQQLPLDADIPETCAEGDRHREPRKEQRRRHLQRHHQVGHADEAAGNQHPIDPQGILPHREDQQASDDCRNDERDRRL